MKTQIEKAMQWFNDQGIRAFITKHDNGSETLSIRMGSFDIVVSDNEIAHRANLYTIDNPDTPTYRFPRVCSITGEGMWEGYCFRNGEEYAIDKESAMIIVKRDGYESLDESYEDENHYYTEWEDLDEDGWYESEHEDGTDAVWVEA